jgi:acetolactate synthase I/II/III large subunit
MTQRDANEIPVANGAEAFLAQIRAQKSVRYIFANTGTDHGPIIEALARTAKEDPNDIQTLVVPHEQAAVSMAHGYYNVTGKPQVVLVHTLPGTANAVGGIMNAHSANVPLVLVAGRTPVTEGEVFGGKSRPIHWRQESRDQGAIIREFVKWDFENRSNRNLPTVVSRAFKVAMSEPRGPVYLVLPREWLAEPLTSTTVCEDSSAAATKSHADPKALEQAADWLLEAHSPLIATKYIGRNPEAVPVLVELAEVLATPVAQLLSYVNFPTDHPLYVGSEIGKQAKNADVVFLIDIDVPWLSLSKDVLGPGARLIHLERDPLFSSIPVWGFAADLPISGCSEIALPALVEIVKRKVGQNPSLKKGFEERRKKIQAEHDAMIKQREARLQAVRNERPIHPAWLSKCLGDAMDEKTILVCESVTSPLGELIDLRRPGSFFNTPPAGHLGWGVGAAIGTKLGAPDHTVIAAEGDGAYMFSVPTACHFTSQKYGIPLLTVVYNNQAWNASINSARELYPDGVAHKTHRFPGCDLSPSPRFDKIAEACGAYGERVEDPAELPAAIDRALKVVRQEKRQALLDVICKCPI